MLYVLYNHVVFNLSTFCVKCSHLKDSNSLKLLVK